MEIVKISIVGANENLSKNDVLDFLRDHPMVELGVEISHDNSKINMPRFNWMMRLQRSYEELAQNKSNKIGRIGLHVNGKSAPKYRELPYPLLVIDEARIPPALVMMSNDWHVTFQINFRGYKVDNSSAYNAVKCLRGTGQIVVMPFNVDTESFVREFASCFRRIYDRRFGTVPLQILYDSSNGKGISSKRYMPPVFDDMVQGYAGGLNVDNVQEELDKIAAVQTNKNAKVYLDAESGLCDCSGTIDLNRADMFYKNVMEWMKARQDKIRN